MRQYGFRVCTRLFRVCTQLFRVCTMYKRTLFTHLSCEYVYVHSAKCTHYVHTALCLLIWVVSMRIRILPNCKHCARTYYVYWLELHLVSLSVRIHTQLSVRVQLIRIVYMKLSWIFVYALSRKCKHSAHMQSVYWLNGCEHACKH